MNIFEYRLLQGIAKGKIKLETGDAWQHHFQHAPTRFIKLWHDGKQIAIAECSPRRPGIICICGTYISTTKLYALQKSIECVEQRKKDQAALGKLMKYLSGNEYSSNQLINK